jgi:hypothetical protein
MSRCTVCNHPQLLEINQAILSKDFTLAALSQKFGLHPSSLQRHKNHIDIKMSRTHRRLREIREQGSLLLLNDILEKVRRNIAAADSEGNYNAVFRGSYIASRLIHQMGRIEGDMQPDTLHRLISSPGWVPQASLLPTDPRLITGLHQGLLDGAFAPCPEPPPEISIAAPGAADDLDLVDQFLETGNSELETGLATLRQLLPDLDLTLDDISPEADPEGKNKRKITEKSAPNIAPDTEIYQQYQKDELNEKNLPKNPACAPKIAVPAPNAGRDPQGGECQSAAPPAFLEKDVHPAVSATTPPQYPPDEAQAAELAAYLAEFAPYAPPAQVPGPNPSSLISDPNPSGTVGRENTRRAAAAQVPAATGAPPATSAMPNASPTPSPEPVFSPETANGKPEMRSRLFLPEPPEGVDFCAAKAAELFLMTHGYPRDNPPKSIPNRRRDEDSRGFSLFREIKKYF